MADAFFNSLNQRLEPPLKAHLRNVYASLAMCTMSAATGGFIFLRTDYFINPMLASLASIGLLIWLLATRNQEKQQNLRMGLLLAFGFVTGYNLGPLLETAIIIDPSILVTALASTALVFVCFTLSALYSNQYQYLYLGGTLSSFFSILFWMSFANLFFHSTAIYKLELYLGLAVFCGYVCYDTQLIVAKRRLGEKDFIWHAMKLFVDLVEIFIHILRILLQNEREKRQNERRRK